MIFFTKFGCFGHKNNEILVKMTKVIKESQHFMKTHGNLLIQNPNEVSLLGFSSQHSTLITKTKNS